MSIRWKLLLWLAAVVVPVVAAAFVAIELTEDRLAARVHDGLEATARLEASRIIDGLDRHVFQANSLAQGEHVLDFMFVVDVARRTDRPDLEVGGYGGFSAVDPLSERPLDELAAAMGRKAQTAGAEVRDIGILDRSGELIGATPGFRMRVDAELVDRVTSTADPAFGPAFREGVGDDRVTVVHPVLREGEVIGSIAVQCDLASILALVTAHAGIGETSEAHLAQPSPEGDADFITPLRFEPDAAFSKSVPAELAHAPIIRALDSDRITVVESKDYRGVQSVFAIQTLPRTGWGLVVKLDKSEAYTGVEQVRTVMMGAGAAAVGFIVLGWMVLARPLSRRLHRTAEVASNVARGELHQRIDDDGGDEIATLSSSIDYLAEALEIDIERRTAVEAQLRHRALHDHLTGLANRDQLIERLDAALACDDAAGRVAVLFCDVDGFKGFNDQHGHNAGDQVLRVVAQRLRAVVRPEDVVARFGGDEFVIMLVAENAAATADAVAGRIREAFAGPVPAVGGPGTLVAVSVGVAVSEAGQDRDLLLRRADMAMYVAKTARRRRDSEPGLQPAELHRAFAQGELAVYYQPIVELGTGAFVGAEALVRWDHPMRGQLLPADFLPSAEVGDLMGVLDRFVLEQAIARLGAWQRSRLALEGFRMAVNLSPAAIDDNALVAELGRMLDAHGVDPPSLQLEISERSLRIESKAVERLGCSGATIAVDDFGTLSSNLDRVCDLPTAVVKIDRRWIAQLGDRRDHQAIVKAFLDITAALGVETIAEGVETEQEATALVDLGCRFGQGYCFGPALPSTTFEARLINRGVPTGV